MKLFTRIGICVFLIVSLLHLIRVIFGLQMIVGTLTIPVWASILGFVLALYLSIMLYKENK